MYRFFSGLKRKVKYRLIKIYAFYGPAGTGKSHQAFHVAYRNNIETIIDDGLLIHRGVIIGGLSSKKAATQMEAVRRAIFYDEDHKEKVEAALKRILPDSMLVIGTSKRMVHKIVERLSLRYPVKYIHIDDVLEKDIQEKAKKERIKENKHVIPVPSIEIHKRFPGVLVDSIEFFFKKKFKIKKIEKSVVRPFYNTFGKLYISKRVITTIITYLIKRNYPGILINNLKIFYTSAGSDKRIEINLYITLEYGMNIMQTCHNIQILIKNRIEYFTGLEVKNLNLKVVEIKGHHEEVKT